MNNSPKNTDGLNNDTLESGDLKADTLTNQTDLDKTHIDKLHLNLDVPLDDFISPEPFSHQQIPQSRHRTLDRQKQSGEQGLYQQRVLSPEKEKELIRYNHISYVLYLLSFFTAGLTWIIPIFMNYYKRREAEGTWLETHFDWQIKTFWYSIIIGVVCVFLFFFGLSGVGFGALIESGNLAIGSSLLFILAGFIFLLNVLWHLYRIVRGWIALSDGRAV